MKEISSQKANFNFHKIQTVFNSEELLKIVKNLSSGDDICLICILNDEVKFYCDFQLKCAKFTSETP